MEENYVFIYDRVVNTLAYFTSASVMKKTVLLTKTSGNKRPSLFCLGNHEEENYVFIYDRVINTLAYFTSASVMKKIVLLTKTFGDKHPSLF